MAATRANVAPADLPAGWTSDAPAGDFAAAVLGCVPATITQGHVQAQSTGPRSSLGTPDNQVHTVSVTTVFNSPAVAAQVATAMILPAFGSCATPLVRSVAGVGSVSGGPLVPRAGLPARGQQSTWFRGQLVTSDPLDAGVTLPIDALLSVIRTGPTVTVLVLVDVGGLVNQWMINDLSQAVADHQRA